MCVGCDAESIRVEIESVIEDKMCEECVKKIHDYAEKNDMDSIADVDAVKVECHQECIDKVEEELVNRFN